MPMTIKLGDTGDKREAPSAGLRPVESPGGRTASTGVFGPETEQAVKDFQQSNGLVVGRRSRSGHMEPYPPLPRGVAHAYRPVPLGRWWPCCRVC